jgi:GMP synthase (glutamine-hydrolysing)
VARRHVRHPAGAVRLGRSAAYLNQAFRFGEAAYGVQFHVEVIEPMLAEWRQMPTYQESAKAMPGDGGFQRLAAAFAAARDSMARSASDIFAAWLDRAGRMAPRGGA